MSFGDIFASSRASFTGFIERSSRSLISCSRRMRVSFCCMWIGPLAPAVIKGRLISVSIICESSILAFSAASDFQHRNIERAAAEVVHGDGFVALLFEAVSQRRRRRFIDDADHFQARDLAGL